MPPESIKALMWLCLKARAELEQAPLSEVQRACSVTHPAALPVKLPGASKRLTPCLCWCAAEGEQRAVVLVGSQKTLPIAVTVLGQLSAVLPGPMGIAVIPCVVSHLSQILLDSFLVSWWLKQDAKKSPQPKTA